MLGEVPKDLPPSFIEIGGGNIDPLPLLAMSTPRTLEKPRALSGVRGFSFQSAGDLIRCFCAVFIKISQYEKTFNF